MIVMVICLAGCVATHHESPDADLYVGEQPVMWMSDLYEPVNDPDDHYDLAVSFSQPGLEPDLFVLDDHLERQTGEAPALRELAKLLGRPMPEVALSTDIRAQIRWIELQPDHSVKIVSLGALTSLARLIGAEPALVANKVSQLIVVAGDASPGSPIEYNVAQDPAAFVTVLSSGLRVYWVPAFDGGLWSAGTSSFTRTSDFELLRGVDLGVRCWFDRFIGSRYGERNIWAAGLLTSTPSGAEWTRRLVTLDEDGRVSPTGTASADVFQLVVTDRQSFQRSMIQSTNRALQSLSPEVGVAQGGTVLGRASAC